MKSLSSDGNSHFVKDGEISARAPKGKILKILLLYFTISYYQTLFKNILKQATVIRHQR